MIHIDTLQDMQDLCTTENALPAPACRFLGDFLGQLQLSLDHDGGEFRLSDHGYALLVLPPGQCLSTYQLESWSVDVEYAERIALEDCQLFKVCLMEDNDRFTFLISLVGSQPDTTENWFAGMLDGGVCL
ncbi:hypothetical protein [Paenibacillus pasadenensis]|uniref:hypothetical protein n=1 Tax=Paenibacillus pasadenensis TaxID=217090 RepID=UPI000C7E832B|nr:hypothetical protein [Paenibacillus pasadenensis]